MNREFAQIILNELNKSKYGLTINNLMERTGLARGTIRGILDIFIYAKDVEEIKYNKNTKVYYAQIKRLKELGL